MPEEIKRKNHIKLAPMALAKRPKLASHIGVIPGLHACIADAVDAEILDANHGRRSRWTHQV